jgi:copper chaperone CopZ
MKFSLTIQNLKCGGCQNTINKEVSSINGITAVEISEETSTVSFHSENEEQIQKVVHVLKKIGYPVVDSENTIVDKAKSYVSCMIGRVSS